MNRFLAIVLVALVIVVAGCKKKEEAPQAPTTSTDTSTTQAAPRRADSMPDSIQLMLIAEVPLGVTYQDVKVLLKGVGPKKDKGIAELSEARAPTRVFNHGAVLDLEFNSDRLYSYFYRIEEISCPEADSLYGVLQSFYTRQFGPYAEEQLHEGAYRARNSFWKTERFNVAATRGQQGNKCRLAWGFQLP